MKKTLLSIFIVTLFLLNQVTNTDTPSGEDNSRMERLAREYSSTVKLEAHILGLKIFSGSAVYIGQNKGGDYIALTNAHCVMPWCRGETLAIPLSISLESGRRFDVVAVDFHPKWFSSDSDKKISYDIVKLKLSPESHPNDATAIKPTYYFSGWDSARELNGLSCTSVGYGITGGQGDFFNRNDGRKKYDTSIMYCLQSLHSDEDGFNRPYFMQSYPIGYTQGTLEERDLFEFESRSGYGMSGGGLYREENAQTQLIGLNCASGLHPSIIGFDRRMFDIKALYQNNFGKYLAALGVPMPFMDAVKGQISVYLNLSAHKKWIEAPIEYKEQDSQAEESSTT